MRRYAAALVLAVAALLLTPGAAGSPDVPGDPTPPVVTPVVYGTLGANGWYTTNVTVNWSVTDPESVILSTSGCDAITLTAETTGTTLTCSATSDGGTTTVSKTLKLDKTPPAVSATPGRAADANGWYNRAVSVSFSATDGMSGVDSCVAPQSYSGPDSVGASVSGSCVDKAGNRGVASFPLKYDATAPQVAGMSAARAVDANGWYNHPLTVSFSGSDATSGVDFCTQPTYSGPDTASASVSGSCRDKAGNQSGSSVFGFKYDATGPSVSATPGRTPDANGWYNHLVAISFAGADATSGGVSCVAPQSYAGPDSASASVTGSCADAAGNRTTASFALKYDATGPTVTATAGRGADANGWYNHPLTVSFAGSDGTSGVESCVAPQSYSGPDSASASVNGSCLDKAGNVALASLPLKYDATAPQVTATPARGPDVNGWYNRALTVTFSGSDATSGIDSCASAQTYAGPDSGSASVGGSCRDKAGNVGPASFAFKYDATGPQVTATPARGPDANGWYNHSLTVSFAGTDGTSGLDSCAGPQSYAGPDGGSASVTGTCLDKAGNVGAASFGLKYDATAPQGIVATSARGPDTNGWFNHPLTVSFSGTDATSGVDSCTQITYSGPDTGSASVSGSCRDKAGNQSASSSFALRYDATGPSVSPTPTRAPDANGWYDRPLTVAFDGSDPVSGIASCVAPQTFSGPDSGSASLSGSCSDKAGNVGLASFGFRYDATPPAVTATADRSADANGWYNHAVGVSFQGNDATSGLESCVGPLTYGGPDSVSASVTGSCIDKAGNFGLASLALKYDGTGPQVTPTPARTADANGWYNHALTVSFAGSDTVSGLDSCVAPQTYSGPDDAGAGVSGSCRDNAGNSSARSFALKYDATAPQVTGASPARTPDANGWYNHPIAVAFAGTDATSGVDGCSQPTYAGPDDGAASLSGVCRDRAGNQSGTSAFALRYDATAPQVTSGVPVRPPDRAGWYNHAIAFGFQGMDTTSGIDACPPTTYTGPDGAGASVAGACIDEAGNRGVASFPLNYDATGPTVNAVPARPPDADGWYNHPLTVGFAGNDATAGLESCSSAQSYAGPDNASATIGGSCVDKAGNAGFGSLALKYDATAPKVTGASPARAPDANGWYNHPISVGFRGSDETSHVAACTETSYAGPDNPAAAVSGSCRDHAGNESASSEYGLKYDATPPRLTSVSVTAGDRVAVVRWQASPDTTRVELVRFTGRRAAGATIYRGTGDSYTDRRLTNGVRYRYAVSAFDDAGNDATRSVVAVPRAALFRPPAGAKVSAPPLLAWRPAPGARYYNVQVWRQRKIFSAWPSGTTLHLKRSWTFEGRRYSLSPGRYRWYVWPGRGPRTAKRYGPLLGASSFVVVAPTPTRR